MTMDDAAQPIAVWNRRSTSEMRARLTWFRGNRHFDVRLWGSDGAANVVPTRKGISVSVEHLADEEHGRQAGVAKGERQAADGQDVDKGDTA